MTYTDTMNKYRASKVRVTKLQEASKKKIAAWKAELDQRTEKFVTDRSLEEIALRVAVEAEEQKQRDLLSKFGSEVSEVTGQTLVFIDKTVAPAKKKRNVSANSNYDRAGILARIIVLKEHEKMSFNAIASRLNAEGYKPRTAKEFTQATVYVMYREHSDTAVASIAVG